MERRVRLMTLTTLFSIGRRVPIELRLLGLLATFGFALIVGSASAEAPKSTRVYRIGYLGARAADAVADAALRAGLRELGYIEGKNLVIESRYAGLVERPLTELSARLADELVHLHVDVIVTSPAPSVIRAATQTTRTIPIVVPYTAIDPVTAGFVQSLARPGGNITGLINLESELYGKRLELLKEARPGISRVYVLWRQYPPEDEMKAVLEAGQAAGIEIRPLVLEAPRVRRLEEALSKINGKAVVGLMVTRSGFMKRHRARIIDFVDRSRLPTVYGQSDFVEAGGLMSYEANREDLYRRAATYVDRILKGAKPGDLPLGHPTKFEFSINLKTASKLGLVIPLSMVRRADHVIH